MYIHDSTCSKWQTEIFVIIYIKGITDRKSWQMSLSRKIQKDDNNKPCYFFFRKGHYLHLNRNVLTAGDAKI